MPFLTAVLADLLLPECPAPLISGAWKNSSLRWPAAAGAARLGPVRVRQVRQPPAACSPFALAVMATPANGAGARARCYAGYPAGLQQEPSFRTEGGAVSVPADWPWLAYRDAVALGDTPLTTPLSVYPGSGYVLDTAAAACGSVSGQETGLELEGGIAATGETVAVSR